ncbi:MAG: hypothetical protein J7K87_03900 [Candidatus Aenigmarchaeota archaeon]|nr:hypothetical protein [Candidatus Aenigmarchaeota archaeon]
MKIAIIGSSQYYEKMFAYAEMLKRKGHEVRLPVLDDGDFDELHLMEQNRDSIEWAEEIHMFWDGRSQGTWGDFCMAFALRRPVKLVYLEQKSIRNIVVKYCEEECHKS